MTYLLDINVLIALFDPAHVHHEAATLFDLSNLAGHRQVSDLSLSGLAMHFAGRLATFDSSIPVYALVKPPPDLIAVVPTV